MAAGKFYKMRRKIIIFTIILSIVLYLAGVLSGLYANKFVKEETKQDIQIFKKETESSLGSLQSYVQFLDANLKNMQLEQTFIETLGQAQVCDFLNISRDEMIRQLRYYWSKLPYRIEDYEKNIASEEYLLLKQQYEHLSIRTWIIARTQYNKCNINIAHGLYFYANDCPLCVQQGQQIDQLNKKILASSSDLIMFPVDFNSEETITKNLKSYYGINSVPAIIINDKVFQGRLFTAQELMNFPRRSGGNGS
ncbi:hypothetical protein HYS31_02055 [Candidatus Woesearchaeota archaeon]|nr:hypothetical protein [Candidatus Woesearchaeota archaeon]